MPLEKLLKSGVNNGMFTGALSGFAGGTLASALTNKKSAKTLLKTGGLVAIGGLAWHAFQKYREPNSGANVVPVAAAPTEEDFAAVAAPESAQSVLLLKAMIAAGYADGHLTELEQERIWQQAIEQGVSTAALAELKQMLAEPVPIALIVAQAPNLESKIEVYAASLAVIEDGCEQGQGYLKELAVALQLPTQLVAALHNVQG